MQKKKNYEIMLFVFGCICINLLGRTIAQHLVLPVWLDSVGTVIVSYALGPVCGTMVGLTGNILYYIYFGNSMLYGITSIAIGVTVGVCAKKGFMESFFGTLSTAFLITIFSVAVSVPINFFMSDGTIGNVWGDGVSKYLVEKGCNRIFSCIIGQFYLDFLDKVITMLILALIVQIVRMKRGLRKRDKKKNKLSSMALYISVFVAISAVKPAYAQERSNDINEKLKDYHTYTQTLYNGENSIPGGMANDIAQTKDGVLWIGTYNGLYRYSGNDFQWINNIPSVKTVNCLFTDEVGRMWVGTNDNGITLLINQKAVNVINKNNGLPSDSVRCIEESADGSYYVGTTGNIAVLKLTNGLEVYDTIDINYAYSITADKLGNVAAVTDDGTLYLIRGTEIIETKYCDKEGADFTCCTFDDNDMLYVGSSDGHIEIYQVEDTGMVKALEIDCNNMGRINSINFPFEGEAFICMGRGIGHLDGENNFTQIRTNNFDNSVDNMLVDYQNNLWFASSRRGLLRMCPSAFTELNSEAGALDSVVNAVIKWQGCMYFGTDNGLVVSSTSKKNSLSDNLVKDFKGIRIRNLYEDKNGSLWICTAGSGAMEITADGKKYIYDSTAGTMGDKIRSIIEQKDGTVVIAGDYGVTYIKDRKVCHTIGANDGLPNPKVLCLYQNDRGRIYAGTDGNGIAIIENGKVLGHLNKENGLSSEVILRMVKNSDDDGVFVVTGSGLCYMDGEDNIRLLENFPYYNNYDVVEGNSGEIFVLCSAGIYVADKESLLKGGKIKCNLLNSKKGLHVELTPNSWNYIDEKDNIYMSGSTGVACMNLNSYNISARSYRLLLNSIFVDGNEIRITKGENISIPRKAKEIEIYPEVVNYSVNDVNLRVFMEGYDSEPKVISLSEMNGLKYANLPSGEYILHVEVFNNNSDYIMAENTFRIIKEKEFYDNWWFLVYMIVVGAIFISYITWLFFRTQIQSTLRLQKLEIEQAKKQIQMGNETILTIAKTVDAKDENTSQHSSRVAEYSVLIASKLGYDKEARDRLKQMALLHDIGKIGVPDRVLNKPAKLTDEEYEIMKSHVLRGAEILKNFTLIDNVEEGVLYHHERYDGKGYVHGLKGEEISLNARIIGVADAFDAMTANRVYRKKLDFDFVLSELKKGRGTQFDPKLVDILLELIDLKEIDVEQIYHKSKASDNIQ